jgi:predicted GNAT family N-acyltransferase
MTVSLRETPFGSDHYKQSLQLRHRILRAPLGLDLFAEDLGVEQQQRHFSLWQEKNLLACLVIVPVSASAVKLRQMAVNDQYQRRGYGQQLIASVESVLTNEGIGRIELHARVRAIPFYQACGYHTVGEIYTEVGIPHQTMVKSLHLMTSEKRATGASL